MREQIDILKNGRQIVQNKDGFMFGIDAILLSDFARSQINQKDTLVDLCCGNGIIPLMLCDYVSKIVGVEIQKQAVDLVKKSIELNEINNIEVLNIDLKTVYKNLDKHAFNIVTCNPPYMINQTGKKNEMDAKTIARHEVFCNLEDVIMASDYVLHTHGKLFMIHRPNRLAEIFYLLKKYNLEPKRMKLVYPFENEEPNLVLIEARKNAKPGLIVEKNLIVRKENKEYTNEVERIYESFEKVGK